ncbi:hypothetical protein RHMOL_Rhmol12G0111400 [Rhododendron molle]|uniref:Uncharacterized protein n=1 Tax=Rhododendron molle TaxID=49168 RepID=A0ACC0LID4_RHOML|nr:hypothetical protein RHMOL_Rhmol12G0111400 [Rhododendron molle]
MLRFGDVKKKFVGVMIRSTNLKMKSIALIVGGIDSILWRIGFPTHKIATTMKFEGLKMKLTDLKRRIANYFMRPLRIPEQQQGLDDTDCGNSFRPDRSSQHSGVFQKLLDGKLFPCSEEQKDRSVSTQREQNFRPGISQNMESPIMRQNQPILSSQELSQVSEELPHPNSILSSEQITDTSQVRFELHTAPILE